jgi:ELWxxDGT repeat protein
MVADIYPGSGNAYPGSLTDVNGTLYFSARDDQNGNELWKSDGTAAGTTLVKNIAPGGYSYSYGGQHYYYPYSSYPADLTAVNGRLFFTADNGKNGNELWVSDGTSNGTKLVKDIWAGATPSYPSYLTDVNGTLFFAATSSTAGRELWKSDGTANGTTLVKNIVAGFEGSWPYELLNVNGTLYFFGGSPSSKGLWKSNGTSAGTTLVKEFTFPDRYGPGRWLTHIDGQLFFSATDGQDGWELWTSDGTPAGTSLVKDINPGQSWSGPAFIVNHGGQLLFSANDGLHGYELWTSDGTDAGTALLTDIRSATFSSYPWALTGVGGQVFFSAYTRATGTELWKSDGTATGTALVKDIAPGTFQYRYGNYVPFSSHPRELTAVGGQLFFTAQDSVHGGGSHLWISDGTPAGTSRVQSQSSRAYDLTAVGDRLFFVGYDEVNGHELWTSDGTAAGTSLVKDLYPGTTIYQGYYGTYTWPNSSSPQNLTGFRGEIYFTAYTPESGTELWRSDGTAAGTALVKDIVPGDQSAFPRELIVVGDLLYFVANGNELWRTDGTPQGTQRVVNLVASFHGSLTHVNGLFFYVGNSTDGAELWKTDGTVAGTSMVKDIFPGTYTYSGYYGYWTGPNSSWPSSLTAHNGVLYFSAEDGVYGRELWKSDGTPAGTSLVRDLNQGPFGGNPVELSSVDGALFFTAYNDQWIRQLWITDGTYAGTIPITDFPSHTLSVVDNELYFVANDGLHGYELWKLVGGSSVPPPTISIDDLTITEGHSGTQAATFTVSLSRSSTSPITVAYSTANGTAAAKSDYLATSGTLTFASGELSQTITVMVKGDRRGEKDETLFVNLSAPTNATLADDQGQLTIIDDEPKISINDASIIEGDAGTRLLVFTVTLSLPYDQLVTVSYKTVDGQAKVADLDYIAQTGTLAFNPGETSKTIAIEIIGDTKVEANQVFYVNLYGKSTNAYLEKKRGVGTILNDD